MIRRFVPIIKTIEGYFVFSEKYGRFYVRFYISHLFIKISEKEKFDFVLNKLK